MSNREAGGCPYTVPHHGGLPRPLGLCSLRGIVCISEGACSQPTEETPRPFGSPQDVQLLIFSNMQANQTSRCIYFSAVQVPVFKPSYGASSERFDVRVDGQN